MKKKYLYLAIGALTAATMGFVSCGDDDEDLHKNKQEQTDDDDDPEDEFQTALSSDGKIFNTGYVKIKESITVRPYINHGDSWTEIKDWKLDDISYDTKYVRVEKKLNSDGKIAGFVVSGVEPVELTTFEITYIAGGKKYSSEFSIQVLDESDDEKEAKRRSDLRSYWLERARYETAIDVMYSKGSELKFLKTETGLIQVTSTLEKVENPNDGTPNFRPISTTNIFPGSLVYIDDKVAKGETPDPVTFNADDALGECTVYVTFLSDGGEMSRENVPMLETKINAAISDILKNAGGKAPAKAKDYSCVTNSVDKMALDLNCSASFAGAKMNVKTSSSTEKTKMYSMQEFTQEYYTVRIEPKNNDRTNYLGKDVTLDIYKRSEAAVGKKIGIIKSVTYGRWAYYKKEYESSSFTFKGSEDASYQSYFSADSKQDISKIANSTKEDGQVYGGGSAVKISSEEDFLNKRNSSLEFSFTSQGDVLWYEVEYIGTGHRVQTLSTGSYYEVESYLPCTKSLHIHIRNNCGGTSGWCVKPKLLYRTFQYVNNQKKTVNKYLEFEKELKTDDHDYDWNIDLDAVNGEDVYFEPVAYFGIRYKGLRTGFDYEQAVNMTNKVFIGDGQLDLKIEGSCNPGYNIPWVVDNAGDPYDVLNKNVNFSNVELPQK